MYNLRRFADAITAYSSALELAPRCSIRASARDIATLHYNRARAAYRLGQHVRAVQDCADALSHDSTYRNALAQRAECYMSMFDFERAARDFQALLDSDPSDRQWARRLLDARGMRDMTHYQVLGVARDASGSAVKKAYRAAVLRWHPDKHTGSDEATYRSNIAFTRITKAYECVSDSYKRMVYDMEQRTAAQTRNRAAGRAEGFDRWFAREQAREQERAEERQRATREEEGRSAAARELRQRMRQQRQQAAEAEAEALRQRERAAVAAAQPPQPATAPPPAATSTPGRSSAAGARRVVPPPAVPASLGGGAASAAAGAGGGGGDVWAEGDHEAEEEEDEGADGAGDAGLDDLGPAGELGGADEEDDDEEEGADGVGVMEADEEDQRDEEMMAVLRELASDGDRSARAMFDLRSGQQRGGRAESELDGLEGGSLGDDADNDVFGDDAENLGVPAEGNVMDQVERMYLQERRRYGGRPGKQAAGEQAAQ